MERFTRLLMFAVFGLLKQLKMVFEYPCSVVVGLQTYFQIWTNEIDNWNHLGAWKYDLDFLKTFFFGNWQNMEVRKIWSLYFAQGDAA